MSAFRRPVYFNPAASAISVEIAGKTNQDAKLIRRFHRQLPGYSQTGLVSLNDAARELGFGAVYLKDETSRLGLPSFKILGASWGSFRALAERLNLPLDTDLETLKNAAAAAAAAAGRNLVLYAATDGNHGRAVARMGTIFGIASQIHVPSTMHTTTVELIQSEGATVVASTGSYDDAVLEAQKASNQDPIGVLIQDFAFGDYNVIPQWIVDGYGTMMDEIQEQLDKPVDLAIAPVGVGSFAQAVIDHFKRPGTATKVATVEPDTAACVYKSLQQGQLTALDTSPTIMAGLDCGTPSTIAWPLIKGSVDSSLTVSDFEAHEASLYIREKAGVSAGPCGTSSLAALWRLTDQDKQKLGLNRDSVVVLFCTEGSREYQVPRSVATDDPVELTQSLVQINSASPTLGTVGGPGETEIAQFVTAWLEHRGIETHWIEPTRGRPSVIGVARGSGGGKSLMFNGHVDTVTLMGYDGDPLSGSIKDGKLYGRGAADMKCGLAAAMVGLARAKQLDLRGDVILAAVADEEDTSIGTEQVLQAGWRADAALVNEPTNMEVINSHRGFVWLKVRIYGVAYHGSRPDIGVDAIAKAGYFLVQIDRYGESLLHGPGHPEAGRPSVHASLIKGGEEISSYPAECTVEVERRTVPGETPDSVRREVEDLLESVRGTVPGFKYDLEVTFHRPPFGLSPQHPFTRLVTDVAGEVLGHDVYPTSVPFWTDCALLFDAGIPCLLWGPKGDGLHSKCEWVDVESIRKITEGLVSTVAKFCS